MNPIQPLKKYAHHKRSGGTKYYIDCSFFSYNSKAIRDSITTNKLIRNTDEVSILQAIATDKLVNKKHKRIVVKIDKKMKFAINNKYHSFAEKEFTIGEALKGIPGFIKFICVLIGDCTYFRRFKSIVYRCLFYLLSLLRLLYYNTDYRIICYRTELC